MENTVNEEAEVRKEMVIFHEEGSSNKTFVLYRKNNELAAKYQDSDNQEIIFTELYAQSVVNDLYNWLREFKINKDDFKFMKLPVTFRYIYRDHEDVFFKIILNTGKNEVEINDYYTIVNESNWYAEKLKLL